MQKDSEALGGGGATRQMESVLFASLWANQKHLKENDEREES